MMKKKKKKQRKTTIFAMDSLLHLCTAQPENDFFFFLPTLLLYRISLVQSTKGRPLSLNILYLIYISGIQHILHFAHTKSKAHTHSHTHSLNSTHSTSADNRKLMKKIDFHLFHFHFPPYTLHLHSIRPTTPSPALLHIFSFNILFC